MANDYGHYGCLSKPQCETSQLVQTRAHLVYRLKFYDDFQFFVALIWLFLMQILKTIEHPISEG